jgi:hypothetical protein
MNKGNSPARSLRNHPIYFFKNKKLKFIYTRELLNTLF